MYKRTSMLVLLVFFPMFYLGAAMPEEVTCGSQKLSIIKLGSTTVYLLRGDMTVIIDTGNPGDGEEIISAMNELGIDRNHISLILLTHSDPDHAGSAAFLKERLGAPVAIHELDAQRLKNGVIHGIPRSLFGKIFNALSKKKTLDPCQPDIMLCDGMKLTEYRIDAQVVHTPGHTPGSVSILLPSGEAIVGDLVFANFPLSFRKPGTPMYCDNLKENERSIKKLLNFSPSILYAAHGGPFDPDDVSTR